MTSIQDHLITKSNELSGTAFYYYTKKHGYYSDVVSITSFLQNTATNSQRYWHLKNNYLQLQTCYNPFCHNSAIWDDKKSRYVCCSPSCIKMYFSALQSPVSSLSDGLSIEYLIEHYSIREIFYYIIKHPELYDNIKNTTTFLPLNAEPRQRIWHLKNKVNEIPKCHALSCSNSAHWYAPKDQYASCSRKCATERMIKSNQKKYGVNIPSQLKVYSSKIAGTIHLMKSELNTKRTQAITSKYGVDNVMKISDVKTKMIKSVAEFHKDRIETTLPDGYKHIKIENGDKRLMMCPKGHEFSLYRNTFIKRINKSSELCTICNPLFGNTSEPEKEITEFIKQHYAGEIITNSKKIISPLEIDIYLPELKLGIEHNGVYYHSVPNKPIGYHKHKRIRCLENGIRLIQIWEDLWYNKRMIIEDIILRSIDSQNHKTYFARKLSIKPMMQHDANQFLTENHIQGQVKHSYAMGLFNGDELLQMMAVKYQGEECELVRMATKLGHKIVGGASRLLQNIIKNLELESITTFCDHDLFAGTVYEKIGFIKMSELKPDYFYIDKDSFERSHKFNFRKDRIAKMGIDIAGKTESELTQELGLFKCFNSGKTKYLYRS